MFTSQNSADHYTLAVLPVEQRQARFSRVSSFDNTARVADLTLLRLKEFDARQSTNLQSRAVGFVGTAKFNKFNPGNR